jgi:hypothetical protein
MSDLLPITLGVEITEPNWPLMCVALTGHAMRALGYLEAGRSDLALKALQDAKAVGDLALMIQVPKPSEYKNPYQQEDGTFLAKD